MWCCLHQKSSKKSQTVNTQHAVSSQSFYSEFSGGNIDTISMYVGERAIDQTNQRMMCVETCARWLFGSHTVMNSTEPSTRHEKQRDGHILEEMKFFSPLSHLLLLSHRMWWRFADHSHQQQQQTPESSNLEIRKKVTIIEEVQKKKLNGIFSSMYRGFDRLIDGKSDQLKVSCVMIEHGRKVRRGKKPNWIFFSAFFCSSHPSNRRVQWQSRKKVPAFCVRRWSDDVGVNLNFFSYPRVAWMRREIIEFE